MDIITLMNDFNDEDSCYNFLMEKRWGRYYLLSEMRKYRRGTQK